MTEHEWWLKLAEECAGEEVCEIFLCNRVSGEMLERLELFRPTDHKHSVWFGWRLGGRTSVSNAHANNQRVIACGFLAAMTEPAHTDECQLTCEHCRHGTDCYKSCCWCGAVRDGEGEPQTKCTCKVKP